MSVPLLTWFHERRPYMLDVLGPLVDLPPETNGRDFVVIPGVVPRDTTVPLHSHPDRETILIVDGHLEAWLDGSWRTYGAGEMIDIPPDAHHALRSGSLQDVATVMNTTARMASFFRQISAPQSDAAVTSERISHFAKVADAFGYWNGSPDDQARVGIAVAPG